MQPLKDVPIQNDLKLLRLAEITFNCTKEESEQVSMSILAQHLGGIFFFKKSPICCTYTEYRRHCDRRQACQEY